jgi:probable addiction module antidote protein
MKKYRDLVLEMMKDPEESTEYLKSSLDDYFIDGNLEALLTAIKTVAKAQCGMTELSKKTSLNRQSLYKTLSKDGNPRIKTLWSVLNSLGYRLTLEPVIPFNRIRHVTQ